MSKIFNLKKFNLLLAIFLCCGQIVLAQKVSVSSTIVDITNEPIIGATILEKGTSNGTVSDYDGNFSLDVGVESTIQ